MIPLKALQKAPAVQGTLLALPHATWAALNAHGRTDTKLLTLWQAQHPHLQPEIQ